MHKYKVCFATGSRADYGIVRSYLRLLNEDDCIDLSILITGALLDTKYGKAKSIIQDDGFNIGFECPVPLKVERLCDTTSTMSAVLDQFGKYFEENRYDLVIILGDRYEIFSVAIAAAMQHLPILNLHGGEITLSNYDEFIRHSITKMSRFHFTSTEEYRNRVIQLGEEPSRVFNLGALGAENCLSIDMGRVNEDIKLLPEKRCFTVLFHPETLNVQSPLIQVNELLTAIEKYLPNYEFCFIGSNADTKSDIIRERIQVFCGNHKHTRYYENLHPDAYHYLVKKSIALLGNSSSGIIEVPSLNSLTINIGDRQTGRVKGNSIIDVCCNTNAIIAGIERAIESNQLVIRNPYLKENSAQLYYETTTKILTELAETKYKRFYDFKLNNNGKIFVK